MMQGLFSYVLLINKLDFFLSSKFMIKHDVNDHNSPKLQMMKKS